MAARARTRAMIRRAITVALVCGAAFGLARSRADAQTPTAAAPASTMTSTTPGLPPGVTNADVPLANVIGHTMREIPDGASAGPGDVADAGAWRPYRGGVFVQFAGTRVVRATARVRRGASCVDVARGFGFAQAMPPLRRAHGCEWPARSLRHLLATGLAASFDAARGTFEVWVVD